jgi:glutathione S-transferase
MSPCSQKVRIVLAEKAIDWHLIDVDLPGKANLEADYLKLNPLGVVPTLVEDGRAVIESSIICEYLEDRFPLPTLRPTDAWQVARMRYWMKHIDNKLHPSCGALQWPLVMADKLRQLSAAEQDAMIERVVEKPRRERQRRLLKLGYEAPDVLDAVAVYQATLVEMDEVLATQPWLAGSDFSLADAAMAPYFQTLEQFGWSAWYALRPRVAEWYANVRSRPSYQSAATADYSAGKLADLAARGAPAWLKIKALLAERGIAA